MSLLAADLRALGNVLTARTARRVFVGHTVTLLVLASVSAMVGDAMLHQPELRVVLDQDAGRGELRTLLGASVAPSLLVAVWFGFGYAWRTLFESPELPLWRQAPLRVFRPPLQVLLRVLFLCWLWATAMVAPFACQVLSEAGARPWVSWLVPLAVLLCLLPTLATVMAMQMAMQRFLAGPVAQTLATILASLAWLVFAVFLTASAFAPGDVQAERLVDLIQKRPNLSLAGIAADLLAAGAGAPLPPRTLLYAVAWVVGPLLLFLACSLWYPRAVEKSASLGRRRRGRWLRQSWPEGVAASIRRKELAQIVQQPGYLIGMVLFGALIWLFASRGVLVQPLLDVQILPDAAKHVGAMLLLWAVAVLMSLNGHMARLTMQDTKQWSLYQLAPMPAAAILRGKLQALFVLLLWPVVLVALIGVQVLGAGTPAVLMFFACGLLGTLLSVGVLAFVGTLPWLVRPDPSGRPGHGARPLLGAGLLVVGFYLALCPVLIASERFLNRLRFEPGTIGDVAWSMLQVCALTAMPVFLTGTWLGSRNFARLLRAHR